LGAFPAEPVIPAAVSPVVFHNQVAPKRIIKYSFQFIFNEIGLNKPTRWSSSAS
jgi:hypothetical protein